MRIAFPAIELVLYLLELKMRSADKSGPVFASRVGARQADERIREAMSG